MLAAREKTEAQLRAALARRGYPPAEIDEAVARLLELGFLDDRRAAEALARAGLSAHQSRAATARKLGALGLADDVATAAVEATARELGQLDEHAARALLARRRLTGVKAARFLAGRGFDEALIRAVVGLDDD